MKKLNRYKFIYRIYSEDKSVMNYIDFNPDMSRLYHNLFSVDVDYLDTETFNKLYGVNGCLSYAFCHVNDESFKTIPEFTRVVDIVIPRGLDVCKIYVVAREGCDLQTLLIDTSKFANGKKLIIPKYVGYTQVKDKNAVHFKRPNARYFYKITPNYKNCEKFETPDLNNREM